MAQLGLPVDRISLVNSQPHWTGYHQMDISLDCFPHNAGTTTFEALWMGVPVLTKLDRPSVGRIGASILAPLGLGDWVAEDTESYIEKAVKFASDLKGLKELRKTLRQRLEASDVSQSNTLTLKLEGAYQEMYHSYTQANF